MLRTIWLAIVGVGGWRHGINQQYKNMGAPPNRRRYPGRIGISLLFLAAIVWILTLRSTDNLGASLIFLTAVAIWLGLRRRRKHLEQIISQQQYAIWERQHPLP